MCHGNLTLLYEIQDFEANWPLGPGLIKLPVLIFSTGMELFIAGVRSRGGAVPTPNLAPTPGS